MGDCGAERYDPGKDFQYISVSMQTPNVLVASPKQTVRTAGEVVEVLKKEPGNISFASSGNGASDHLAAELFWHRRLCRRRRPRRIRWPASSCNAAYARDLESR